MTTAQHLALLMVLGWAHMHVLTAQEAMLDEPEPLERSFEAFWGAIRHG